MSQQPCITDLFYGTDYNSHLGTRRGGMATYCSERGFSRSIHNLENTYFRTRFEAELDEFHGNAGIGIISDTDAQPLLMNSHLGRFAIVTVARINNLEQLAQRLLDEGLHLSEFSSGRINPTELIALLIIRGFWIALHARDRFGALMVVGVMTQISLQTFLNIAVVTGLIPATGISLPFFSYGGTALMLQLVEMGIVLSVSRQIPAPRNG